MKINRNRLLEELRKTPAYQLAEKGDGWRYVYERLYAPFMHNREISLGALDFMAFTSDDVLELLEEFYDSFMRQLASNENMKSVLRSAAPLPSATPFL